VLPIAIAAASPTARVSVATAITTSIRKKVGTTSHRNDCPSEPEGSVAPTCAMLPRGAAQERGGNERAGAMGQPVPGDPAPGEVTAERKGEGDGRVDVSATDMAERPDDGCDYEAECDRDADVAELVRLGVNHYRPRPGEDESERADQFCGEGARERRHLG
jgi:hypothetical protein